MISPELSRRVRRFAISGLLVTGIHVLIAAGMINFVTPVAPLANGVAFVVATAFSYAVNTLWSFSSAMDGGNFVRFISVALAGLLLAVAVSGAAEYYGFHYMVGIGLVACTVPPTTFLLHYFWTYRKVNCGSAAGRI